MNFRRYPIIIAILLLTVLFVQPALSADNVTTMISQISGTNVTKIVTNNTADLEKDNATKFFNYGQLYVSMGDFKNATTFYDLALAENMTLLNKTYANLYLYQGKAYALIQLGNYTDAIATVDAGLALYPGDAVLWNNKGIALENLGKTQDALIAYDKAVSFDQNYTLAYVNKGILLSQMGRYSEAVAAYTKANETKPFNEDILNGLAAAKKSESQSFPTMTILIVIVLIAAAGAIVWYVKFRKPAEPAPEEKKEKTEKK
jgi:tetratricopeptide (TPR) repeat protein